MRVFVEPRAAGSAALPGDAGEAAAETHAKALAQAEAEEAAALKESIVARHREDEAAVLRAKAQRAVTVVGVAALLATIGIPGAMQTALQAQFDSAGVDDDALANVIDIVNDDPEGEGQFALDEMVATVGLRGGAEAKIRAKLLKKNTDGGGGRGGGNVIKGGRKAKRGVSLFYLPLHLMRILLTI